MYKIDMLFVMSDQLRKFSYLNDVFIEPFAFQSSLFAMRSVQKWMNRDVMLWLKKKCQKKGNGDDDDDMKNTGEWADEEEEEKDFTLWNWKLEWVT